MKSLLSLLFGRPRQNQRPPRSAKRTHLKPLDTRLRRAQHGYQADRHRHHEEIIAYHGTPSVENAKSILRNGWAVGLGNAHGDGIYATSDIGSAKSYAGANGVVMKLSIRGKVAIWSPSLQARFTQWCTLQKCPADMSAKSSFLLDEGYGVLRNGNVIVVLMRGYRNFMATKIRTRAIRVISITRASDGSQIRIASLLRR